MYYQRTPFLLLLLIVQLAFTCPRPPSVIIGILSTPSDFPEAYNPETISYVRDTYPDYIRDAGGIPIFIPYDLPDAQLYELLDSVHGLVLTGGDAELWIDDKETGQRRFTDFVKQTQKVVKYVEAKNKKGIYMPLYAICQGMEVSFLGLTDDAFLLDNYDDSFERHALDIIKIADESRMFSKIPLNEVEYLRRKGTLFYNHEFGYNVSSFNGYPKVKNDYSFTALSVDVNNKQFVAAIEAKYWPFYGVIFHPERVVWENETGRFDHNYLVVDFVKRLARFFINESRRNIQVRRSNKWRYWSFSNLNSVDVEVENDTYGIYTAHKGDLLNKKTDQNN